MTTGFGTGRAVEMSDEEFLLIRDLITSYCGIYFDETFKYLVERRLQPRLPVFGFGSFRDYYRHLKYSPDATREFDEIVERITTNETYFFREAYQLKAFTDEVLPDIMRQRNLGDRIRIWSAGCSTGEEPYSISMLLDEIPAAKGYSFDIFGNDISRKVLKQARSGMFRESSFRQTDPAYIDRYFKPEERNAYRLADAVRERVTFGHLNLMDEASMALISNVDVIFCRNVIIYFSAESRHQLIAMFHRKLRPGGYLLLGHSESLVNLSTDFELVPLKNDIVYRKPGL
ncbi:MAG: protein-glutamate O-methyltransferase CheR [Myxococcota bacterium]